MNNPDVRVARSLAACSIPCCSPAWARCCASRSRAGLLVGLSRQRVNEALSSLQEQGIIRVEYGGLRILTCRRCAPPLSPTPRCLTHLPPRRHLPTRNVAELGCAPAARPTTGSPGLGEGQRRRRSHGPAGGPAGAHRSIRGRGQRASRSILLHKPIGYVSGQAEEGYEPAVVLVQGRNRWKGDTAPQRFAPAQLKGWRRPARTSIPPVCWC